MISIKIDGEILDIDLNLSKTTRKASLYMKNSLLQNFEMGGRPTWLPLKSGGPATLGGIRGMIAQAIGSNYGDTYAEAGFINFPPPLYAMIQQTGGIINHPGSDKFQVFTIGGRVIFTHGTIPHQIPIPARPYIMWQDEDLEYVKDLLGQEILIKSPINSQS